MWQQQNTLKAQFDLVHARGAWLITISELKAIARTQW